MYSGASTGQVPQHTTGRVRWGVVVKRRHAFYSHWCSLMEFHLKRRRLAVSAFAEKCGRSQQAMQTYVTGRCRPPLDQVGVWAAQLGLNKHERDQFVESAYEAWTPEPIWARLITAESKLAQAPRSESSAQLELAVSRAVVADLVNLLRDLEALFYDRTVPVQDVPAKRRILGEALRAGIVNYGVAPDIRLRPK